MSRCFLSGAKRPDNFVIIQMWQDCLKNHEEKRVPDFLQFKLERGISWKTRTEHLQEIYS